MGVLMSISQVHWFRPLLCAQTGESPRHLGTRCLQALEQLLTLIALLCRAPWQPARPRLPWASAIKPSQMRLLCYESRTGALRAYKII